MAALNSLLETRTGQQLAANREWRIETALKPLLRDLNLATLDDLVGAVQRSPDIADQAVDALLNQESSFFRDGAVIELVAEAVAAIRADQQGRRVRIWSAGCCPAVRCRRAGMPPGCGPRPLPPPLSDPSGMPPGPWCRSAALWYFSWRRCG